MMGHEQPDMSKEWLEKVCANLRRRLPAAITDDDIIAEVVACRGHGGRAFLGLERKLNGSKIGMATGGVGMRTAGGTGMTGGVGLQHSHWRSDRLFTTKAKDLVASSECPLQAILSSCELLNSASLDGLRGERWGDQLKITPNAVGLEMHEQFLSACQSHPEFDVELVFHGTADENVAPILASGLDPRKRGAHGQAFGPGEYFARDPLICLAHLHQNMRLSAAQGQFSLIIFAVLIDPASDGLAGSANLARRVVRGKGPAPIVVIQEQDRQLPLAVLTVGGVDPVAYGQAQQQVASLVQAASDAAKLAAAAEQGAKAAEARAAAAEAKAAASKLCADVILFLIREDMAEAIGTYGHAIELNGGTPPDWGPEILPFMLKYQLPDRRVQELFPMPHGVSASTVPLKQRILGKRRCFNGTVEVLQAEAVANREKARRLNSEAAKKAEEAKKLEDAAKAARAANAGNAAQIMAPVALPAPPPPVSPPKLITPSATRRIMKELCRLHKAADVPMTVELPDEGDCYTWRVAMRIDEETPLGSQLSEYAASTGRPAEVHLEISFTGDYPSAPPFVRVVSPRFKFHTGHVTVGGSICMEELTTSAWNPETTVEGVLHMVQTAFVSGEGRLDHRQPQIPYSEVEAKHAFARVARAHGWQ